MLVQQNKLISLGKGSLYEQWELMIQDDPTFTPVSSPRISMIEKVFRREGVDYFNIWFEIFADLDTPDRGDGADDDNDI